MLRIRERARIVLKTLENIYKSNQNGEIEIAILHQKVILNELEFIHNQLGELETAIKKATGVEK